MHYKSLYPPLPAFNDQNVHDFIFSAPAQKEQPDDKDLLIDPLALKKWTKGQFRERVYDCTTALVTPVAQGGLGLAPEGEMVAIMSTNCLVSPSVNMGAWHTYRRATQGIHYSRALAPPGGDPVRPHPGVLDRV